MDLFFLLTLILVPLSSWSCSPRLSISSDLPVPNPSASCSPRPCCPGCSSGTPLSGPHVSSPLVLSPLALVSLGLLFPRSSCPILILIVLLVSGLPVLLCSCPSDCGPLYHGPPGSGLPHHCCTLPSSYHVAGHPDSCCPCYPCLGSLESDPHRPSNPSLTELGLPGYLYPSWSF